MSDHSKFGEGLGCAAMIIAAGLFLSMGKMWDALVDREKEKTLQLKYKLELEKKKRRNDASLEGR